MPFLLVQYLVSVDINIPPGIISSITLKLLVLTKRFRERQLCKFMAPDEIQLIIPVNRIMMHLFNSIMVYVAVAEEQGFLSAASRLKTPTPAVSREMDWLE
jgi:hypothetical protein